ncbi:TetR/AcrR family transcriptional regulator [Vibrio sp. Isolate22]|uniref:TetR/AcrR family transcriptional regulator n=1 Tax=Vibrio sp. Isolate22 TaxID=2908532 RepID=UPI001EFD0B52|nr:TetR/AcrR family transcriptional regulator [Vibrio sp. Isolate22]MCG9695230.1 TetR/AcrR family transcriptional regulator [Vibrio sp. Isolate22]
MTEIMETKRCPGRPSNALNARDELLKVTRSLFLSHSYSELTTRLVSKESGFNISLINYYFKSKDNLILSMLKEHLIDFNDKSKIHFSGMNGNAFSLLSVIEFLYENSETITLISRVLIECDYIKNGNRLAEIVKSDFVDFMTEVLNKSEFFKSERELKEFQSILMALIVSPMLFKKNEFVDLGIQREQSIELLKRIVNSDV